MESIKTSSLKTKEQIINDLKGLLVLVNDGKEGYQSASEATESQDLKAFLSQTSGERIVYASELKEHIEAHGGEADNENGGLLGGLHRAWLNVKQAFSSNDDQEILKAITTGERAVIAKYDELIADFADHSDHIKLLTEQRDGVANSLTQIEKRIVQA
ncbi:PA2169 family four-helix-bundle protein [Mucilaginibacter sp. CSA2-8R]|uniref:ferritin-like domain-containing protein n=1 Tax=Mucilaginibacter sp. CSA2-8R TaxID=3141542 RepID=UPI00315DECBE